MSFLSFWILEKIFLLEESKFPYFSEIWPKRGGGSFEIKDTDIQKMADVRRLQKKMFSFFFHVSGRSRKSTTILVDGCGHCAECL